MLIAIVDIVGHHDQLQHQAMVRHSMGGHEWLMLVNLYNCLYQSPEHGPDKSFAKERACWKQPAK